MPLVFNRDYSSDVQASVLISLFLPVAHLQFCIS